MRLISLVHAMPCHNYSLVCLFAYPRSVNAMMSFECAADLLIHSKRRLRVIRRVEKALKELKKKAITRISLNTLVEFG